MVAERVKELREALGLAMPAFGKKLGVSRDVIANLEYKRVEPKDVFVDHICEIYGVNRQWLYHGTGPMLAIGAEDEQTREAAGLFRGLSPELRELALSQLKSLHKLMERHAASQAGEMQDNLDTVRLTAALLEADDFTALPKTPGGPVQAGEYIRAHMRERGLTPTQLAGYSLLAPSTLEEILQGRAAPTRDALVATCIALALDVDETQRLLAAAGLPALYAKNRRDYACMFALMKGLGVTQLNEMLQGLEEAPLVASY